MATEKYEAEFSITDLKGDYTGTVWNGKFKVRTRLSFRDHLRRDEIRRTLLGATPGAVSEGAGVVAAMASELAVRILPGPDCSPSWWKGSDSGMELADLNLLTEIFMKATAAEADLVKALVGDGEKAQADLKANPPAATE